MASEIKELDVVALMRSMPDLGLDAGQTGTVVHVHGAGKAFEVEFPLDAGRSVVETIEARDLLKLLNPDLRRAEAG